MSTQAAVSGQPYKNNGGVMKKAGSANTAIGNPITKSRTLMDDAVTTPYGAKVVLSSGSTGSSGNVGTFKSLTNFAQQMLPGHYIMKKRTFFVNGSANSYLTSCASESSERMRAIPYLESTRTYGSGVSTSFNPFTGQLTKGGNAGGLASFGNDHAARPTDAIPGELVYKTGAKLPVQNDYAPKYAP
jgi:hypothetical protein